MTSFDQLHLTDEQLMEQLQQGQTKALDALYKRYAKKLYAFCYHTLRSGEPQTAEDLVQDVFVRVIRAAATFNPQKASFRTWLFRIARNRCLDLIRRRKLIQMVPLGKRAGRHHDVGGPTWADVVVDPSENVEGAAMKSALLAALRDCIQTIESQEEKQALLLYYLGGKVYREIGQVLGKSTGTAKNRVRAAQDKVKQCLERKGINIVS